ncbi:MAG: hypothetical protein M5U34_03015 [Chloroflexi bacterium]|nr:hypothetical protein [Chloroflexota bacterium]
MIGAITFYMRPRTTSAQILALLAAVGAVSLGAIFDLNTSQFFIRIWLVGVALWAASTCCWPFISLIKKQAVCETAVVELVSLCPPAWPP